MVDSLGGMLICFGDIEVERSWGDRHPPENEEQRKARLRLGIVVEERKKTDDEYKKKTTKVLTQDEEDKRVHEDEETDKLVLELTEKCKPKEVMKVRLAEMSIHDLLIALNRMSEYDRMMSQEGILRFNNWDQENKLLEKHQRPFLDEHVRLDDVPDQAKYSTDPEVQTICEGITDMTSIPEPPESAKNAFAMTLFCMEAAFDCRSKDFLTYAFDSFPDRDYLIVTQPHTVAESQLLNKFTLVQKQSVNTF